MSRSLGYYNSGGPLRLQNNPQYVYYLTNNRSHCDSNECCLFTYSIYVESSFYSTTCEFYSICFPSHNPRPIPSIPQTEIIDDLFLCLPVWTTGRPGRSGGRLVSRPRIFGRPVRPHRLHRLLRQRLCGGLWWHSIPPPPSLPSPTIKGPDQIRTHPP